MKRSLESQKDGIMVVLGEIFEPVAWDFVKMLKEGATEVRESLEKDKSNISLVFLDFGNLQNHLSNYLLTLFIIQDKF